MITSDSLTTASTGAPLTPLTETIKRVKGGYRIISHTTGRNLGTYRTRKAAKLALRRMAMFREAEEPCHWVTIAGRAVCIKHGTGKSHAGKAGTAGASKTTPAAVTHTMPGGSGQVTITTANIENFRGNLAIRPGDLPFDRWDIFDRAKFDAAEGARVLALTDLVSTKNQLVDPKFLAGKKPDPRATAFARMVDAAEGRVARREPLAVSPAPDGRFYVEDGNATAQVLMLAGWTHVPVVVKGALREAMQHIGACRYLGIGGRAVCVTGGHNHTARLREGERRTLYFGGAQPGRRARKRLAALAATEAPSGHT